jgi:hypothetical protein
MAKTTDSILIVKEAFVTEVDGERLEFSKGDPIEAVHPAVKANPHLFGPVVFRHPVKGNIEQATAAPGEKRNVTRPKAKEEPKAEPKKEPTGKKLTTANYKGRG